MKKVYELIDTTPVEVYHSLGIFESKMEAQEFLNTHLDENSAFSEYENDENESYEIKIRLLNVCDDGGGKPVAELNRTLNDDGKWINHGWK